jgi:hypothetical protein
MKKSYHSNAVPADEAMTTRLIDHGRSQFGSATPAIRMPLPRERDSE